MKRTISESVNRNNKQQHVYFTIPIARYVNRAAGKKAPSAKGQVKLEVLKQKILIKEQKNPSQWIIADILTLESLDKVEDIQKPEQKYTLLKIQLNTVPQKDKQAKAITFRVLNINLGRQVTAFIRKNLLQIQKLPNYVDIEAKQANVMKSIILMQSQYNEIYKKAHQKKIFSSESKLSTFQFQRLLLQNHPQMIKFNLLKQSLKYQQQKRILLQKLKMNADEVQKQEIKAKKYRFEHKSNNVNLIDNTNINFHLIQEDLQKIKKDGKQSLEGYSSKRQFQGMNIQGGQDELYLKEKSVVPDANEKNQMLILKNIHVISEDANQHLFDQNYIEEVLVNINMKKSASKDNSHIQHEKMQIQEGQINEIGQKNGLKKVCNKLKIPDSKDVRLQQKKQEVRNQKKTDIKFIDPSYNFSKELSLTKQASIWCRLFYHYLKEGGIERRENELTSIQTELKRLKHLQKDCKMNELVSKMVDKVSFNYLRMKRGQDVY